MSVPDRHFQIQRVLIITLVANLFVAFAKVIVGVLSGSLAMVADGFHSSLDGLSNVIGLISNKLASRPPDEEHPYGHRRIETLASLAIGGVLLLTAWEIIENSIQRLTEGGAPQITALNFAAMLGTLGVNLAVTVYERRAGRRLNSEFLLADAEHTRSDIFVSLTVLASLVAVRYGIDWIDPVAALVVVALIAVVAGKILRHSAAILVDRAVLDSRTVSSIAKSVAGVGHIIQVRSRGPSDDVHLDLDVEVAGPTTAERSDAMAREMRTRLRKRFPGLTDIRVYFYPQRNAPPDVSALVRAEADALGIGAHEITSAISEEGMVLELHVEVPPDQSIGEAHMVVTEMEERLQQVIPNVERIVTHIEPAPPREEIRHTGGDARVLARQALNIARELYPAHVWHDLDIRAEADGGYALSMHCHVPEDMRIEDAHHIAETVETQLRATLPSLHRVTIHTEPPTGERARYPA